MIFVSLFMIPLYQHFMLVVPVEQMLVEPYATTGIDK